MPNLSKITKDHDVIRSWAEARGAKPSHVKRTGSSEDVGILRFDFPGYSGEETLEPIAWEQFFEKFDERNLALLYEEETAGGQRSNFNKLVSSETAAQAKRPAKGRKARSKKASVRNRLRPAAKKAPAKKSPAKKSVAKKSATKKSTAKKSAMKRRPAKKTEIKKAAPKKTSTRARGKKVAAKKSPRGRRR